MTTTSEQTTVTPQQVLACPMRSDENDAGAETVGEYLLILLRTLWDEEEGFSGKRPFGTSSWQIDVYQPLIEAGLLAGTLDDDGFVGTVDREEGHRLVVGALHAAVLAVPSN